MLQPARLKKLANQLSVNVLEIAFVVEVEVVGSFINSFSAITTNIPRIFSLFRALAEGILADNPHLVLLFYLAQLFLRELIKSHRLVQVIPMDMSGYYENRAGPSNLGNVISQILLCKQITPDFNQEELCSITKDSQVIAQILQDLQEFMPQQETYLERTIALTAEINGPWPAKRRRGSLYKNMGLLCCVSRPNYL
ncbi:uncharacterized protein LOC120431988 [Culex pipiens pallens]|uniref:uncharacterized protein LOC120431988 n=1 Tax=Culex pipiens pallens TaxID=42434 RepID=UPI001953375E|nr:uncharacterized protein LOC120431988 [Culex pipiens pallens]